MSREVEDSWAQILAAPIAMQHMPPVMCQECSAWWQVEPGPQAWVCPECGRRAIYSMQPGRCERCQQITTVIRHGHDVSRTMCRCHWTREQHLTARREELLRKQQEERARVEEEIARVRRAQAHDGVRQADRCFQARFRQCVEPRNALPYEFCGQCERFSRTRA